MTTTDTFDPSQPSSVNTLLDSVDKLKFFLATAPSTFSASSVDPSAEDRIFNRFLLPTGEYISCVLWNGLYHVTGTDIVRALNFRFLAFGRPVRNSKKFEEGVFSDLRNLKSGTDATLEEPKSEFLEMLFKSNCIRTQKKQKVFYWFSVPHDRLFLDALDRDLKREKLGQDSTTEAVREPALSFRWNPSKTLFEQFTSPPHAEGTVENVNNDHGEAESIFHLATTTTRSATPDQNPTSSPVGEVTAMLATEPVVHSGRTSSSPSASSSFCESRSPVPEIESVNLFGGVSLFEGSPTYKQRRRPCGKKKSPSLGHTVAEAPQSQAFADQHYPSNVPSMTGRHRIIVPGPGQLPSSRNVPCRAATPHSDVKPNPSPTSPLPLLSASPPAFQHSVNLNHALHPSYTPEPAPHYGPFSTGVISHEFAAIGAGLRTPPTPSISHLDGVHLLPESNTAIPATHKTYVCPLFSCGRLFKRLEHLKRHVRIHTSERPFKCPTCTKTFARSDNLAAHTRIHDKLSSEPLPDVSEGDDDIAGALERELQEEDDLSTITNSFRELSDASSHDLNPVPAVASTWDQLKLVEGGLITDTYGHLDSGRPYTDFNPDDQQYRPDRNGRNSTTISGLSRRARSGTPTRAEGNVVRWLSNSAPPVDAESCRATLHSPDLRGTSALSTGANPSGLSFQPHIQHLNSLGVAGALQSQPSFSSWQPFRLGVPSLHEQIDAARNSEELGTYGDDRRGRLGGEQVFR